MKLYLKINKSEKEKIIYPPLTSPLFRPPSSSQCHHHNLIVSAFLSLLSLTINFFNLLICIYLIDKSAIIIFFPTFYYF